MSISADDGEPVQNYQTELRRARLEHRCSACHEKIHRGDWYRFTTWIYDGEYENIKRCLRCEAIYRVLLPKMRELEEDERQTVDPWLDCGHTWEDNFHEPPPPEVARLAFMTHDEIQAELAPVFEEPDA